MNIDNPEYKKYLKCVEKENSSLFKEFESYNYLYPHLDDVEFNKKIFLKKEFNNTKYDEVSKEDFDNIEKISEKKCNRSIFQLSPHQLFVKKLFIF